VLEVILVADVTLSPKEIDLLVASAQELKVRLLHLPKKQTSGYLCHPKTTPLSLTKLLCHKPPSTDWEELGETFRGSIVLVIGAGRGVGQACLAKFANAACHKLVYTDIDPEALQEASQALDAAFPHLFHEPILLDTRRKESVAQTVLNHKPDFVLHASEIVSADAVNRQPLEGLWWNALGVRYAVDAAMTVGCKGFVFVSHEPADQPKNLLLATKRLGEIYVQAQDVINASSNKASFSVVRLKPPLDGKCGLLTHFNKEIQAGGPLMIPHPDMVRTYATLSESADILLQAFRLRQKTMIPAGNVFVQDVDEPLSLYEAANTLVRLHGLTPRKDIAIQWTGLAKGERLTEGVGDAASMRRKTACKHLFIASPGRSFSEEHNHTIRRDLDKLEIATLKGDEKTALALLEKLVPYQEGKTSSYQASA
jgi:O-antigen biosynthesis protein WbqV